MVIPGRVEDASSDVHLHIGESHNQPSGVWIPGLRYAHPGMTMVRQLMSLPSSIDAAIIGAGAAGLGAAHALKDSGLSVIVLEARERVGGRGHTIQAAPNVTFDLGCGWLHSADQNSFVKIADKLHFEIDRTLPPWRERGYGKSFPRGRARRVLPRAG